MTAERPVDRPVPTDLTTAYADLQASVLMARDVTDFLEALSDLAVSFVPDTSCGVTMQQDPAPATVVSSDAFARAADEIQYGLDQGPCLSAMVTNTEVAVPDLAADDRWPDYRTRALANGVRSSLSMPISVSPAQTRALGALNLYARTADAFGEADVANIRGFMRAAGIALALVIRHAGQITLQAQLREAIAARAVIDQALGILMGQHGVDAARAWELLRRTSSDTNRKLAQVAADLILATTGRPPSPPRPFTDPR